MTLSFIERGRDHRSVDLCHAITIFGMAVSAKPKSILELGVGTGLVTDALLNAIEYNQCGQLTCLDSWLDYGGKEPDFWEGFRQRGADLQVSHELAFLQGTPNNTYDFLMSDADHGATWIDQHFRVTNPGAICFFHDTNSPQEYPSLHAIIDLVKANGWSHQHFVLNSRDDERCHRGLLMVINGK
jgi:predicted O-methyltransferase YrrM